MSGKTLALCLGLAGAAFFLFLKRKTFMTYSMLLSSWLPKWEGFSSKPYSDYHQYSWGYGTKVPEQYMDGGKPKAGVSISRAQAFADAFKHVEGDKTVLEGRLRSDLNANQWAALLSFSYNCGIGAALKLVPEINAGELAGLEAHWKKYRLAGGKVNETLVKRRAAEWELFTKP